MEKAVVSVKKIRGVAKSTERCINALDIDFDKRKTYLIKVNLIRGELPPRSTDVRVVEGVCKYLTKFKPKRIYVGEGAAFPGPTKSMERIYRELEYDRLAQSVKEVKLIDLNHGPFRRFKVKEPLMHQTFVLNKVVEKIDYLISVPILKTTEPTVITLGMKNLIGLLPGDIYGYPKTKLHKKEPEMVKTVIDINKVKKPDLTVIDATVGMADFPVSPPYETIVVGNDVVATDTIGAAMMGFDPSYIKLLSVSRGCGLGEGNLDKIKIVGESLESVKRDFPYPNELVYSRTERGRIVSPIHPRIPKTILLGGVNDKNISISCKGT